MQESERVLLTRESRHHQQPTRSGAKSHFDSPGSPDSLGDSVQLTPSLLTARKTHHPRNLTLSPTSFSGKAERRQSWAGRGPYDMLVGKQCDQVRILSI